MARAVAESAGAAGEGAAALQILLPAFAACLAQRGLALDAAELLLELSSTHPDLCTTDAGMYLLESMLKTNASLPSGAPLGGAARRGGGGPLRLERGLGAFRLVPMSALRLADEVPARCQRALRELHDRWL